MSAEVIELTFQMNRGKLKTQLAFQCAPVLTGCKISNMLIVDSSQKHYVVKLFAGTGLSACILQEMKNRVVFLIYQSAKLEQYIHQPQVLQMMQQFGYRQCSVEAVLAGLAERYVCYAQHKAAFPHEMGLILGYPAEDVEGFITNEGRNFLYAGYWKIYANLETTLAEFKKYDAARETVIRRVAHGASIRSIIRSSQECAA